MNQILPHFKAAIRFDCRIKVLATKATRMMPVACSHRQSPTTNHVSPRRESLHENASRSIR